MEPRRLFVVPVALATVALTLVLSSSASAATPPCGSLITENTTLTEDLHCSGDGLVLHGFVDVTLDLNGHTISGDGSGTGITVSAAESATVSVKNGSVRGFRFGIILHGADWTAQLEGLTIRDNGVGLSTNDPFDATLADSSIAHNRGTGVHLSPDTSGFKMVNDQVRNNGGDGISAEEDSLKLLQDSFIAHNGGAGARLSDTVAVVSGNTFLGNAGTGLSIEESLCHFFPFYFVGDNFAVQNGGGGMSMVTTTPDCSPPGPPPGTGNAAQNNDVFQCVLIVCAKNRGLAKKPDPELIRRAESVRHAGATGGWGN